MDESLAGLYELDWFKQSSFSTAALVVRFRSAATSTNGANGMSDPPSRMLRCGRH